MKKIDKLLATIETQELLEKLTKRGYGEFIETLLLNEPKVYTKKGRLNKSGACRILGCKGKQLEDILKECRNILKNELEDD